MGQQLPDSAIRALRWPTQALGPKISFAEECLRQAGWSPGCVPTQDVGFRTLSPSERSSHLPSTQRPVTWSSRAIPAPWLPGTSRTAAATHEATLVLSVGKSSVFLSPYHPSLRLTRASPPGGGVCSLIHNWRKHLPLTVLWEQENETFPFPAHSAFL